MESKSICEPSKAAFTIIGSPSSPSDQLLTEVIPARSSTSMLPELYAPRLLIWSVRASMGMHDKSNRPNPSRHVRNRTLERNSAVVRVLSSIAVMGMALWSEFELSR